MGFFGSTISQVSCRLIRRMDSLDVAEQEIQKAYSLDPNDPKVSGFLGYVYLEKKTKLDEAQRLIQAATRRSPTTPSSWIFWGGPTTSPTRGRNL